VPLSVITSIGLGAISAVVAAVAAALTLLPAVLMLMGDRIDALAIPWIPHHSVRMSSEGWWGRAARRTMRRPVIGLVVSVALLVFLTVPMFSMRTGGFSAATFPDSYTSKQGLDMLQRDFAAGMSEPITVVVDGDLADAKVQDGLGRLVDALDADGRFTLTGVQTSADQSLAVVQLVQDAESMSDEAHTGVQDLRRSIAPRAFQGAPATVHVGGQTASSIDASHLIDSYLWIVVGVVLLLSFVLLLVAFRSVLVAVTAVLMNLLSVAAAFGVLTLVFQEGLGARLLRMTQVSAIESWVPLLMFCVLFGLSMDYQVFLLSRIRERWQATHDSTDAVVFGVQSTAGIITGAALIMIAVFAGLGSGELVILQQLGLGLAVAVLLDAFVVRVLVAPATIALIGDRYWWMPRWLDWLPRVNIEGRVGDPVVTPAGADCDGEPDAG
jgi:putative drug exporter of the RND superfamily